MNNKIIGAIVFVIIIGGIIIFIRNDKKNKMMTNNAGITNNKAKTYTLEEVTKHGVEDDCWMAVEGKVYNATIFITKHPGGKAILNGCGKDATQLFTERPTNNKGPHPDTARVELEKLYIGDLK